jgi:hypothetical protein
MGVQSASTLGIALLAGLPAAYIVGTIASARFGIAGAAGFVGGMVSTSIFLYLRFEQVFLEADAQRIPPPDFPTWFQWFIPAMNLAFALLLAVSAIVFLPNKADRAN